MSKKKLPKFRDDDHEREFWSEADSTEYVDRDHAKRIVLPNLKPSQKTISFRLPAVMPAERLDEELRGSESRGGGRMTHRRN